MRACILAAGIGQRLRPLTDDKPKALVEVDGVSFLERMVRQLAAVGVRELIVATGYREDAVERALKDSPIPWVLRRNDRFDSTQNSVSLFACADALITSPELTFKLDGDVLFDIEVLRRLIQVQSDTSADLVAAIDARAGLGAEEMKVEVADGRIVAFGKHLDPATSRGESIGIELLSPPGLTRVFAALGGLINGGRTDLYYEDVYDRLLPSHTSTEALDARECLVTDLLWTEVDTAEDLVRAGEIARRMRLS